MVWRILQGMNVAELRIRSVPADIVLEKPGMLSAQELNHVEGH